MATVLLSRSDIAGLMLPADYIAAVEQGFCASAQGRAKAPPPLHLECLGGGFHAKGATLTGARTYAALKLNGNFPANPRNGLPTIQGAILLSDASDGTLLAVIDSTEVTLQRTAAATALAARYLARPASHTVGMIGCGEQAGAQLAALRQVLPLGRCLAHDRDPGRAHHFAAQGHRIDCVATATLAEAARADVIVTVTTSTAAVLCREHVKPGTFIAAVGADSPSKQEIDAELMAASRVVVDVLDQCLAMGDLHHAVSAGVMTPGDVYADLAELVSGTAAGRRNDAETWIFDSTGTALEDVASAAMIYEKALAVGAGTLFAFDR